MKKEVILLPARMRVIPESLSGLQIAELEFPYKGAIETFLDELQQVLRVSKVPYNYLPPFRLLNSAITSCSPTIVHGFEKFLRNNKYSRRMVAVGEAVYNSKGELTGSKLLYPNEEKIAQVIRVWIQMWGEEPPLSKVIVNEGQRIWKELEAALAKPPNTQWKVIKPETLVTNLYTEGGLAFDAIPSLLSTLLHGKTSTLGKDGRKVFWRKAQAGSSNRLCVMSDPLPIDFWHINRFKGYLPEARKGYFSYKLEFCLVTQAGRKEPWIHVFLSCQRYAELPLTRNKRGNDISVLVGMNQARLNGWDIDTTLVRLKTSPYPKNSKWKERLPELLAKLGARPLSDPTEILSNPMGYWGEDKAPKNPDEYYVLHTEGYRYGKSKGHSIMTGFGLAERSDIIEQTCCTHLKPYLEPDKAFYPDPLKLGKGKPTVLWNIGDLTKSEPLLPVSQAEKQGIASEQRHQEREQREIKRRQHQQNLPAEAVQRALAGKQLQIALIYRSEETKQVLYDHLRDAFLLNEGDAIPAFISVIEVPLHDPELNQPLQVASNPANFLLSYKERPANFSKEWKEQIRRAHVKRVSDWQEFISMIPRKNDTYYTALIELPEEPKDVKKFHKDQSIKGAIREACVREGYNSQMLHPYKPGKAAAEKGRIQNVVQEVVTRQLGALYGPPAELYQQIGFKAETAVNLDVVCFCLRATMQNGIRYAVATRLRASGEVEVLLPNPEGSWLPYAEAGPLVGRTFANARKDIQNSKNYGNTNSAIKMDGTALAHFVETTIAKHLDRPTIILIEAENWRNGDCWPQLTNGNLPRANKELNFSGKSYKGQRFLREDERINNILGIVRIRSNDETPQYITNRESWISEEKPITRDLYELSGFIDQTTQEIFHYFSVGKLPVTVQKPQSIKRTQDPYKIDDGGGVPFKHQQLIELVPFFPRNDFQTEEGLKNLCRVAHYLRSSPAWSAGNLVLPYPLHIGKSLIEDHLCILGL